jgi:hypothetical protein
MKRLRSREREREREEKLEGGGVVRDIEFQEGRKCFPALKVHRQCPLVLLVEVRLRDRSFRK